MEDKPQLTGKRIDEILKAPEVAALQVWLQEPGWEAIKKLAKAIRDDWASQITKMDWRVIENDVVVKDMIMKQGMLHGIDQFVFYLEKKREKLDEKKKEQL